MASLQDCIERLLTKQNTLFCRLTLNETKEKILEVLKVKYNNIIVAEEEASKIHFHILLLHPDSNSKNARQNLRNYLKESFPELKGNGDYAITNTMEGTTVRLAAYTVKEGNYVSIGFPQEFLTRLERMSYKKFDGKKFQTDMNSLDEQWYMAKEQQIDVWVTKYVDLKVAYNQTINPRTVVPMMNLRQSKKFGNDRVINQIMTEYNRV